MEKLTLMEILHRYRYRILVVQYWPSRTDYTIVADVEVIKQIPNYSDSSWVFKSGWE
jgi:hypothetical protein